MRHRAVGLVRYETYALTPPLPPVPHAQLKQSILTIVRAGIAAADPTSSVERALSTDDVRAFRRVRVVAAGKAALAMASGAHRVLGSRLTGGVVIAPGASHASPPLQTIQAEHPQPGAGSARAGLAALATARDAEADELLLVLVSGGASSLMAVPAAALALDDKRYTADRLMRSGATIHELNTVRKHLSAVKGGRLAAATRAACLTLIVSDVVGDEPTVIASGPTVADPSTYAEALAILDRRGGRPGYPSAVVAHLEAGAEGRIDETPKPGDSRLARSQVHIVSGRSTAMTGAAAAASALGFHVECLDAPVVGEARESSVSHVRDALARAAARPRPFCLVSGGETTVTVRGRGRGGRNQEFALAAASALAAHGPSVVLASCGTDGVDGPTDAAGAMVDATTLERARTLGLDAAAALAANDTNPFFAALGDLIHTGPTGTNVGDLQVLLLA